MKIRQLTLLAIFIASSVLLSNIKLFSTVSLDSFPAFLAAIIISPIAGATVAAVGHFTTALTSGFPFTLWIHLFVMLEMFVILYAFGVLYKRQQHIVAVATAILLNGPVAAYCTGLLNSVLFSTLTVTQFFIMMVIPLTIATAVNVVFAVVVNRGVAYAITKN